MRIVAKSLVFEGRGIKRMAVALLLAAAGLSLSACAHSDLKAPCPSILSSVWGGAFAADECGLMRPVN